MKTLVTIFTYLTLAASLLVSSSEAYSAFSPSPQGITNANHQLISVKDNNGLTRFEYAGQDARVPWAHGCAGTADALGRRVTKQHIDKTGTSTQTDFLWQGDVLLEERTHSAGGKELSKQTYLFKPNSFEPLALVKNNEVYRYHLNHLGTPEAVSNAQGQTIWAASFKSYGNLALKQVDSGEITQPIRFQGQYHDSETGLHYNRHRYYDPNTGSFLTADPIKLLGGTNNYQYVPNPTHWVDPLGLSSKEESIGCPSGLASVKYSDTQPMDPFYIDEDKPNSNAWGMFNGQVNYLDQTELPQYEINVTNGLLVKADGTPIDTGEMSNGKAIFVMDDTGKIYAGSPAFAEFHHSSFLAGKPVAAAGEIEVAEGILLSHSRNSGHYKPTAAQHDQFKSELKDRGLDLSNIFEEPVDGN